MAYPFGGHPSFAQYLEWAASQESAEHGVNTQHSIGVTKITAPSGKWVIEAGTLPNDYLAPTAVGRLDRRLGLVSPWFAI